LNVRRLFSTFAGGLPGAGLVVMRLAAGLVLVARSVVAVQDGPAIGSVAGAAFQVALAILLFAGLWTPLAGLLVALVEIARLLTYADDPSPHVLLAGLGLGLALVGPGIWSVDARLFGWRRIDLRDRRRPTHTFRG
jgi:putative oxidoreductase